MKLDEGDALVRVRTCSEAEDILLSAASGKCIRFPVTDVRVFSGRNSVGVRGMRLKNDDAVIAMSILHHVEATPEERDLYLQSINAQRRLRGGDYTDRAEDKARDEGYAARLEEPRFQAMGENEEFVLAITTDGMGKRTSAYEYRIAGRGGQGITNIDTSRGKGDSTDVVAAFRVDSGDQIIMVTDGGQIIRTAVDQVSIVGRTARGVTLFKTAKGEQVVSVSRLGDMGDDEEDGTDADEDESGTIQSSGDDAGESVESNDASNTPSTETGEDDG